MRESIVYGRVNTNGYFWHFLGVYYLKQAFFRGGAMGVLGGGGNLTPQLPSYMIVIFLLNPLFH